MDQIQHRRLITLKTNLKFNGFVLIDPKLPDKLIPKSTQLPAIEEEEEIDFLGDEEKLEDFKILKEEGRLIKPQEKTRIKPVYRHNQLWGVGGINNPNYVEPIIDRLGVGLMELIDEKLEKSNSRLEARYKELGGPDDVEKPAFDKIMSDYFKEVNSINGTNINMFYV